MTLEEYINILAGRFDEADLFYGHGTDNPLDEAFYLVFAALGLDFAESVHLMGRELAADERRQLDELAGRRIRERLPVAYLVGEAWFAGLPFHVDQHVLIPRSPIAELIDEGFAPLLRRDPGRILDLCTGSGCIGIACAARFPEARVDLADVSAPALAVADRNIRRHALGGRVRTVQSDLFADIDGSYDLIVSNPPYVSREEVDELPDEYGHEPELGLLSGDGGMTLPMGIIDAAHRHLAPGGLLVIEVGHGWPLLQQKRPELPFLWLGFAGGGEGVAALYREQLPGAGDAGDAISR